MRKPGFLLIETLIYIAISSIFLLLLFQFTANIYSKYRGICFSNSINASLSSAIDLISRDIQKASNEPKSWKKLERNSFIISLDQHNNKIIDIGWYLEKNNLYRIEGEYDLVNHSWKNDIKSLVCSNVIDFQIKLNSPLYVAPTYQSKNVSLVSIILSTKIEGKIIKIQKSISPRSGLIIYE